MRTRLTRRLDEAVSTQLTQVVAPVGSGKSSLVASWAQDRDVVWLRQGQHHRLLEQVLRHHGFDTALRDEDAGVSALRELATGRGPLTVVLDDAHQASADVIGVVTRMVAEVPQAASFVMVSNLELSLPPNLADIGVSTVSVRGPDLRFTDEEAESLVLSVSPTIDDGELAAIVRDGRGWAAALVGGVSSDLRVRVLSTVPEQVAALLLATCDEEVLDAPTAVVLTGDPSAGRLMEALAADGLLVDRAAGADREQHFVVHPVLRRALQEGARAGDSGHEIRVRAHLRAAMIPVRNQAEIPAAVRHSILAEDPQVLGRVLREHGFALLERDRHTLLEHALDALPPDLRSSDPSILVIEAMLCRLTMHYDAAAVLSVAAERAAASVESTEDDAGDGEALALDAMALMRLWRSRCGWADPYTAMASARERLGCDHLDSWGTHRLAPGHSFALSTWLMAELATVEIRTGALDEAGQHLREQISNGRVIDHGQLIATGLAHRSLLEMVDGAFQTAAATARSSLDHVGAESVATLPHVAMAHLVAGWGALHELDLETCEVHLASAEQEGGLDSDVLVSELVRLLRARLLAEHGQVEDARRLLAQHLSVDQTVPPFVRRLAAVVGAQTAALVNDVAAVRDRALTLAELGYDAEAELFDSVADAGSGLTAQALERIDRLLGRPRLDGPTAAVAAAARVGLLLRQGDTTCAAERMPDLLARVAPQRLMQILTTGFLGGEAFAHLLVREAKDPRGHPFAIEALTRLGTYISTPGQGSPRTLAVADALKAVASELVPPLVGSRTHLLTPREREVLLELSRGGSYSDVAQALFVSENTVKTHLTSIYRKLGVDRRGDALRIARGHHLI